MLNRVSETIKNEAKEKKSGYISMLPDTLASSLFTDMLLSKKDSGVIRAGEGTIKACGSERF